MDNQTNITHEQIPDVILMENLDPESPSYGAMALGTTGFMIADTRNATNTDWNWSTFGTGRGFNADAIKAGTLEAINIMGSAITGGTITGTVINNGNGTFQVDENGNVKASSAEITGTIKAGSSIVGSIIEGSNIYLTDNGYLSSVYVDQNNMRYEVDIKSGYAEFDLYNTDPTKTDNYGLRIFGGTISGAAFTPGISNTGCAFNPSRGSPLTDLSQGTDVFRFSAFSQSHAVLGSLEMDKDGQIKVAKGSASGNGYTGTAAGLRIVNGIVVGTA